MGPAAWWFGCQRQDWDKTLPVPLLPVILLSAAPRRNRGKLFLHRGGAFVPQTGISPLPKSFGGRLLVITNIPAPEVSVSVDTVKAQPLYE